jgi:hypothetical protein
MFEAIGIRCDERWKKRRCVFDITEADRRWFSRRSPFRSYSVDCVGTGDCGEGVVQLGCTNSGLTEPNPEVGAISEFPERSSRKYIRYIFVMHSLYIRPLPNLFRRVRCV